MPTTKMQNETTKPKRARKPSARPILSSKVSLEVLSTSLGYVRSSGLRVRVGNRSELCVIVIEGAVWNDDTQNIILVDDDTHAKMRLAEVSPEAQAVSA
jgi:hypothetical protein